MSARRSILFSLILLVVQGLSLPVLMAQGSGTTATVKGRVVDTDGAGLPRVVVVIRSKNQGSGQQQVVTDIEGNFRIPLLPPASDYFISVDYPGFAPMEMGPLDLDPGKTTVADLTLRSDAETTETIIIESRGNVVDTESTKTSTSYNAEFIEGLPIIGHNYQDILTLAPGVTDTDGDGNPNVHGARDTGLQYRLDGGNITDPVSGTFGQNLNADIIEEVEIITSGASAEFGRADGGFSNIITKSGGNDFEGKVSFFWQGKYLNGDGADNNDVNQFETDFPDFRDIRASLSLGGAIVKDKLWYFASVETLDTEVPLNLVGSDILFTSRGNYSFGKLTWQVDSFNKLATQVVGDPREFEGFGLTDLGVSPDSDFTFEQGGLTPQLKWTSTISPQLLLEAAVTHFDSGIAITPISRFFEPTTTALIQSQQRTNSTIQALYPCEVRNCDPESGETRTYQFDLQTGRTNGPYFFLNDDDRIRNQLKTDLSYNIEDAWGQHNIKSGIEIADEKFHDDPTINPFLIDNTEPRVPDPSDPSFVPGQIQGSQLLLTANPLVTPQDATSFNTSFYLLDAWKPRPNLTVNVGLRFDREDIDTSGFDYFDPATERKDSIALWRDFCNEALRQQQISGVVSITASSNCDPSVPFNGLPPKNVASDVVRTDFDEFVPAHVAALDVDQDGFINPDLLPDLNGTEALFTNFKERETENFSIENSNLAPRFSLSWDPWNDGKTRAFGNWSRYYDRLFLATVAREIGPDQINFTFQPNPTTFVINPGDTSVATSTVSVNQVDRNLETPYTDELSIGFERELAPEWSVGLTYIRRKSYELLQDKDVNHYTCAQSQTIGISPTITCGDAGVLETDRFGETEFAENFTTGGDFAFDSGISGSNEAPDLYVVNNGFNQVLRVGNFNSSEYEAYELSIVKRLHRNWQMKASYTWSEAFGQAEDFASQLGNDPETVDDEEGFLDFDQTHIIKFQAVTRLPHEISLGGVLQWASGTPYSVIQTIVDQDNVANQIFRTFFPTAQRNDQRNEGFWEIDTRLEKNFVLGKVQAAGFISIENILNEDYLAIDDFNERAFDGIGLDATRDFGRRFELGATFNF